MQQGMKWFWLKHILRTGMWPIPLLFVLLGIGLSYGTLTLNERIPISVDYIGGPDAALAVLGGIAASMIALTATALTIVLVVVQLAMGQFSPRIVRAILHDRPSQFAIGIFVAAFAHSMLTMREIVSVEEGAPVPGLAIIVAFALVVLSIVALILYIDHVGRSLRVAALIDTVGEEMRDTMDRLYTDPGDNPFDDNPNIITAPRSGVVFRIGYNELVTAASRADCLITLIPIIGDFVPAGAPLVEVHGNPERLDRRKVTSAIAIGPERTMNQDLAYGFRMLVDIAERSLVDPFDPTTAVQAIDRLHDGLRQLARRPFPSGEYTDDAGVLRLRVGQITWEGYVRLAFDEIRQTGSSSIQLVRKLRAVIEDLLTIVPDERRAPLERQLTLLNAAISENGWPDIDREASMLTADPQGIGSGPKLRTDRLFSEGP